MSAANGNYRAAKEQSFKAAIRKLGLTKQVNKQTLFDLKKPSQDLVD